MTLNIRISDNLKRLLDEIMKVEIQRKGDCSYREASEILYRRIIQAGGLRKDIVV